MAGRNVATLSRNSTEDSSEATQCGPSTDSPLPRLPRHSNRHNCTRSLTEADFENRHVRTHLCRCNGGRSTAGCKLSALAKK
eukprot:1117280-Prymnesium_polylepis.1